MLLASIEGDEFDLIRLFAAQSLATNDHQILI
jgi:hypothetical protein